MTDVCEPDTDLRWPCATKAPGETLAVTLSAFALCAQYWEANEQWDAAEFVWPSKANGFVAECTTPGRSASKEPRWTNNLVAGATINDGSVVWTLRVPTLSSGIQPMENPLGSADLSDLVIGGVVVDEATKILADYIGGLAGTSYTATFTFNIAGRQRVGSQVVHVAAK